MKILSWNNRGLRNPQVVQKLQHTLKLYNPQVFFFMETKLDNSRMEKVRQRCGFSCDIEVPTNGTRGGLSFGWMSDMEISLKHYFTTNIDVEVINSNTKAT